ncbi:MAG: hypothetical protein WA209_18605, partial [Candidatus Acidiferrales bacterium]
MTAFRAQGLEDQRRAGGHTFAEYRERETLRRSVQCETERIRSNAEMPRDGFEVDVSAGLTP